VGTGNQENAMRGSGRFSGKGVCLVFWGCKVFPGKKEYNVANMVRDLGGKKKGGDAVGGKRKGGKKKKAFKKNFGFKRGGFGGDLWG